MCPLDCLRCARRGVLRLTPEGSSLFLKPLCPSPRVTVALRENRAAAVSKLLVVAEGEVHDLPAMRTVALAEEAPRLAGLQREFGRRLSNARVHIRLDRPLIRPVVRHDSTWPRLGDSREPKGTSPRCESATEVIATARVEAERRPPNRERRPAPATPRLQLPRVSPT